MKTAALGVSLLSIALAQPMHAHTEMYDAALECPGGEVEFGLRIERVSEKEIRAFVTNGEESIPVPVARERGDTITLGFDYYDSEITAVVYAAGVMTGEWRKRRSKDEWVTMPFSATPGGVRTMDVQPPPAELLGRWRVKFASEEDEAVAIFDARFDRRDLRGTFLTTTGDYRYLAGSAWEAEREGDKKVMRLSCFDGSHAFLFTAELQADGSLTGDFWSGASSHDTWTAVRDESAALPDPFGLTRFTGTSAALDALAFPDATGKARSLGEFAGRPRIIEIFGTWCPNCLDATKLLVELEEKHRAKGLAIIGLAFEVTGDAERDRKQARVYAERHGVKYPILVAGTRDKQKAAEAFPVIDRLRAYPTFLFVDAKGAVRGVYTGFSGPATGEEHERLRRAFEGMVRGMVE